MGTRKDGLGTVQDGFAVSLQLDRAEKGGQKDWHALLQKVDLACQKEARGEKVDWRKLEAERDRLCTLDLVSDPGKISDPLEKQKKRIFLAERHLREMLTGERNEKGEMKYTNGEMLSLEDLLQAISGGVITREQAESFIQTMNDRLPLLGYQKGWVRNLSEVQRLALLDSIAHSELPLSLFTAQERKHAEQREVYVAQDATLLRDFEERKLAAQTVMVLQAGPRAHVGRFLSVE